MMDMPKLQARDDGKWVLLEDFYEVPAGFVTDGGSIPRFLWRVCGHPMQAPQIAAYILHDWRYSRGEMLREVCDSMFLDDLAECGVGFFRRRAFYCAVRMFGGKHYNEKGKGQ